MTYTCLWQYCVKPFPFPKVYEETLKTEVNTAVNIIVSKRKYSFEWVAPTLERMEEYVSFLILENLIKELGGNHFLFLKYKLLKLKCFKLSLDLHIGYYHIKLCPFSTKLCIIVHPWKKYINIRNSQWVYVIAKTFFKNKWTSYLMV